MKNRSFVLFVTALFFICHPVWAQSDGTHAGYYITEQRYVQQLVWIGDQYTSRYEVVIERIENEKFEVVLREFTEKATLQISLTPGNYRYRVIPYDYLDQSGEPSRWVTLEINPAPIVPVESEPAESEAPEMFSFYISASWSPLISLHGAMKNVFGINFYLSGAHLRFGVLFEKPDWWFMPGVELSASWYALNNAEGSNEITVQAGTTGINFVVQKIFFNCMAVNVRAGIALGFQTGEVSAVQYKYSTGGVIPQINVEASFLWFAWKQLYLEAGSGYSFSLNQNDVSGCLRPWIGVGWKF